MKRSWLFFVFIIVSVSFSGGDFARADLGADDAVFDFYTAPGDVKQFELSEDGSVLWTVSSNGVEKRDAKTGREIDLRAVDGVTRVLADGAGGLWIGARGLYHLKSDGAWEVFTTDSSELPSNHVNFLFHDGAGGIFVGTDRGATHLKSDGSWERCNNFDSSGADTRFIPDGKGGFWASRIDVVAILTVYASGLIHLNADGSRETYTAESSPLPSDYINSLLDDGAGGAWVGTGRGLAHLKSDGAWELFGHGSASTPAVRVTSLFHDGAGGIWARFSGGVAHLKADDSLEVFAWPDPAGAAGDASSKFLSDGAGGLWMATHYTAYDNATSSDPQISGAGLTHLKPDDSMERFTTDNSNLPGNYIETFLPDGSGGLWLGMSEGVFRFKADGSVEAHGSHEARLPELYNCRLGDGAGGLWLGTNRGLIHLKSDGSRERFTPDNSGLPSLVVRQFSGDDAGGLWMTCNESGVDALAHLKSDGAWELFTTENSALPYSFIDKILNDGSGGLWITVRNFLPGDSPALGIGVAHLLSDGSWELFPNDAPQWPYGDNPGFEYDHVRLLARDGSGGMWFWTGGLSHLHADGSWEVLDEVSAQYPWQYVKWLLGCSDGGAWFGGVNRLVRVKSDGSFKTFNLSDYFPGLDGAFEGVYIDDYALVDDEGGLWVTTRRFDVSETPGFVANYFSLVHLKSDDSLEIFTTGDFDLPADRVTSLLGDGDGGIWIGAGGLSRLKSDGSREIFFTNRDWMRSWEVRDLQGDGAGGLWFETEYTHGHEGLARLSFNKRTEIAGGIEDEEVRAELLDGSRAAMILAVGGVSPADDPLWFTTRNLGGRIYKTLWDRGYNHGEIYFASPSPRVNFNADGQFDSIVDGPVAFHESVNGVGDRALVPEDVRNAFQWAKNRGALTQPLYIHLVGPGAPSGRLMLDPADASDSPDSLDGAELSTLLDDYQDETGNTVVVVIEASYSGGFISSLSDPRRVVVTSSGEEETAFYDQNGDMSFSRALLDALARGENLDAAVSEARRVLASDYAAGGVSPQLDDNGDGAGNWPLDGQSLADEIHLNGPWQTGGSAMSLAPVEDEKAVVAGEAFTLDVTVTADAPLAEVWAVVRPPWPAIFDGFGTPVMNNPIYMLYDPDGDGTYTGEFNDLLPAGEYTATFFARNYNNLEAGSAAVTVTATHPPTKPVWFTLNNDLSFILPCVVKDGVGYEAAFDAYTNPGLPGGLYWRLDSASVHETENGNCIPLQADLSLGVRHAQYQGVVYEFTLEYFPNPVESESNFDYWRLDGASLKVE
ncbi:MAG: hypothetical protein GY859_17120 [Desulfobacterales bacterium]|nr:hypothetical protein [Desulfobacterales bacterium]